MTKSLAGKLAEVLGTIKHIPKNGYNEAQRYQFVRDADVLDAVREALSERGVATLVDVAGMDVDEFQTAKQREQGGVSWMTTVWGAISFLDGDSDAVVTIGFRGTGADTGDKGYYKALTGGVKYALLKTFLIPTGDDPEADADSPQRAGGRPAQNGPQRPPQPRPVSQPTPARTEPPRASTAPVQNIQPMSVRDAMDAVAEFDRKEVSRVAKELVGTWSFKEMTGEQRAQVVAHFIGGGSAVPAEPSPSSPADDENWAGLLDQAPAA